MLIKSYTDNMINVRPHLDELLDAESVEQQEEIYEKHLKRKILVGPDEVHHEPGHDAVDAGRPQSATASN